MNFSKFLGTSFDVALTFALIFSFPVMVPLLDYRSSVAAVLIIMVILVLSSRLRGRFIRAIYFDKYVRYGLIGSVLFMGYGYLWPQILQTGDLELMRVFRLKLTFMIPLVALWIYLKSRHGVYGALRIFYLAFLAQSVIQLGGYCSPTFLSWVRAISPVSADPEDLYGGQLSRGFALCGVRFFGLSVPYSFVLAAYLFVFGDKFKWKDVFWLCVYVAGGSFSARSFFIGLAAALAVVALLRGSANLYFKISAGVMFLIFFVVAIIPESLADRTQNQLFPWMFEFWYNFQSTGTLRTNSSDAVLQLHHFALSAKTIAFGDGYMLEPWAAAIGFNYPYLGTDAGYMRVLGFGGVPYLLAVAAYHIYLLSPVAQMPRYRAKWVFAVLVGLMFVMQIKGDIFGSLTMFTYDVFFLGMCLNSIAQHEIERRHRAMMPPPPGATPMPMQPYGYGGYGYGYAPPPQPYGYAPMPMPYGYDYGNGYGYGHGNAPPQSPPPQSPPNPPQNRPDARAARPL